MIAPSVVLLAVCATVFVAAFLQAASGFGFSLIAVPAVSKLVSPKAAVVGGDVLAFLVIVWLALSQRRYVDVSLLRTASIAACVGLPVGLLVFTHANDRTMAISIAVVVIAVTQDLAAIGGFAATGQFTTGVAAVIAAGLPGLAAGSLIGNRLFSCFDQTTFRRFVLGLLLATGGLSLVAGLRAG